MHSLLFKVILICSASQEFLIADACQFRLRVFINSVRLYFASIKQSLIYHKPNYRIARTSIAARIPRQKDPPSRRLQPPSEFATNLPKELQLRPRLDQPTPIPAIPFFLYSSAYHSTARHIARARFLQRALCIYALLTLSPSPRYISTAVINTI